MGGQSVRRGVGRNQGPWRLPWRRGGAMAKLIALLAVTSLLGCQGAAAVLRGVGCGLNPASCREQEASTSSTSNAVEAKASVCSSDYGCQYGSKCVKAQYQTQGYCAKAVDEYGTPTYPT